MAKNQSPREKAKDQLNLTSIYFNRFLLFRYSTALFFFINLYWSILIFSTKSGWRFLPIILFAGNIAVVIEQTSKYWRHNHNLRITKLGYALQFLGNLVGIILVSSGQQHLLFPFIKASGKTFILAALIIGCLICILIEWRAYVIEHDRDTYLERLKQIKQKQSQQER